MQHDHLQWSSSWQSKLVNSSQRMPSCNLIRHIVASLYIMSLARELEHTMGENVHLRCGGPTRLFRK
jgi:hypothetical protein